MKAKLIFLLIVSASVPILALIKFRWASSDRRISFWREATRLIVAELALGIFLLAAIQIWGLVRGVVAAFAVMSLAVAILLGEWGRIGSIESDEET